MTETRKKIIELIEPWMDKTFTEEVICRYMVQVGENEFIDTLENYYNVASCEPYEEVVGHYDITAVLKAIELNEKKYCPPSGDTYPYSQIVHFQNEYIIVGICDILYDIIDGKELRFESKYKIPNKPLYLYTEEEDKSLLELLQKLGGQVY